MVDSIFRILESSVAKDVVRRKCEWGEDGHQGPEPVTAALRVVEGAARLARGRCVFRWPIRIGDEGQYQVWEKD